MGIEIDFLAVGDGGRSGDAIALRFGNLGGGRHEYRVVVIDGGYTANGEAVIDLVREQYRTNRVDLVVSTHPDEDHARGLVRVVQEMEVGELWMHRPWNRTAGANCLYRDPRVTDDSVAGRLWRALKAARDLETEATKRGVPIVEPFRGVTFENTLLVVGPSIQYYESLLPHFRCTPEASRPYDTLLRTMLRAAGGLATRVLESLHVETLTDEKDEDTSAENNSGTILYLEHEDTVALFTADVGIPALEQAADALLGAGFDRHKLTFVQVPHHGSHRNVGPTVLDHLLGPRLGVDEHRVTAFVSAAKEGAPKHPSKRVTNAFRRRGAPVYATQGRALRHARNAPERHGYSPVVALPLYAEVGDEDA